MCVKKNMYALNHNSFFIYSNVSVYSNDTLSYLYLSSMFTLAGCVKFLSKHMPTICRSDLRIATVNQEAELLYRRNRAYKVSLLQGDDMVYAEIFTPFRFDKNLELSP